MPGPEQIAKVVSEWVAKAEEDWKAATFTLRLGKQCPTDIVSFHAQQVVEKYLKAVLTGLQIPFPKTHILRKLVQILPPDHALNLSEEEQDKLSDYATVARYPGWREIALPEARQARPGLLW
jgi:HEPN domain-containing protein